MPNTFTPEQIAQILEEFFRVVGTRQYIGARYVPLFGRKDEDTIEWDNIAPYEPLTIVLYQGNSYTSRQFVPVGVEITNQEFWAITGNYNAQIEQYRRETAAVREVADNALTAANNAQTDINTLLPKEEFDAENTVKDAIDDAVSAANAAQNDIDTLLPKSEFAADSTVKDAIDAVNLRVSELEKFGEFYPLACIHPYLQYGVEETRYAEGGCIVKDSYCFGAYHSNSTTPAYVYLNGMATNVNRATNIDNTFGHCNDMTYNSKKDTIVIVGTDVGTAANWIIYELDADTLNIVERYVPTINIWSIAYDAERDCYYGIGNGHIYTFDADFNVTNLVEISTEQSFQGICYKDNLIYNLNSTSNSIDVFNLDGTLYNKIPIAYRNLVLELQWCDFYDGDLYIGCAAIQEPYFCMYKTDVKDKNVVYTQFKDTKRAYVDYSYVGIGDGDSSTNPCMCLSAIEGVPYEVLRIDASGETAFRGNNYVLTSRKALTIVASTAETFKFNTRISCYYFDALTMQGCEFESNLVITSCPSVLLHRCVFDFGEAGTPSISATQSTVRCTSCTFDEDNPLDAGTSTVSIANCTFNGTTGVTSNAEGVGYPQPFSRLYVGTEYATNIVVPLIRLYKAFIIEVHDGSDGGTIACLGYNKRNAINDIAYNGTTSPGSANIRTASGTLTITNNMNVQVRTISYVKGTTLSDGAYISAIYGIA